MRTPGKGYDEFYQRVQEEGTVFVRGRVAEVTDALRCPEEAAEDGRLIVQVEDTLAGPPAAHPGGHGHPVGRPRAAGATPTTIARLFGITCSSDGWVIERHPKLDPVATMTEGVFAAGCALGPEGHPGERLQRRRGRGPDPRADPAAGDGARADPGDGRRGALLRLPDLQRPVPVQRDRLPRGPDGHRGQPGPVPGLRRRASRPARPGRSAAPASATSRSSPRSTVCSWTWSGHPSRPDPGQGARGGAGMTATADRRSAPGPAPSSR